MSKVNPGDPIRIKADDWNKLLDVAAAARGSELIYSPGKKLSTTPNGFVVPVKNNTGADISRYHAAGVGAPLFSPTDNAQTFLNQLGFAGEDMSTSYFGKFAVFQETVKNGKIGLAMLQGITVAEITVGHADHDRVDVDTSGGSKLVSQFYGAGEILYKQSGTGTKWAVIRIGAFVSEQLKAVANEDIVVNSSGSATIRRNNMDSEVVTAHLNWMCGSTDVADLDQLIIRFYRDENKYVIEGAGC